MEFLFTTRQFGARRERYGSVSDRRRENFRGQELRSLTLPARRDRAHSRPLTTRRRLHSFPPWGPLHPVSSARSMRPVAGLSPPHRTARLPAALAALVLHFPTCARRSVQLVSRGQPPAMPASVLPEPGRPALPATSSGH